MLLVALHSVYDKLCTDTQTIYRRELAKQINSILGAFAKKTHLKLTIYGILHTLRPVELSKSFSQLIMSIFIFAQYFFQEILKSVNDWESLDLLHIAYILIH